MTPTTKTSNMKMMTLNEIEEESESLKNIAEKLCDQETRAFDLNTEMLRRLRMQLK